MDLFISLAEEEKEWTINDIGRNSISEIHNNPNDPNKLLNSQKQINYDSPVVPSTSIRKVKKIEFQKYTKSIANEYDTYADNKNRQKELEIEKSNVNGNGKNDVDNGVTSQLKSIIPEIYFEKDFNLENPLIFDQVCENINITSDVVTDMTANNILQEKLSNYLDVVEVNLMSEISKKRESFFSALSSLKTLYKEIDDCVEKIQDLKVQLKDVSKSETQKGLEVVCMKRKRVNLENLYNGIRLLSEVRQTQPTIQILLGQNDYIGALDLIEETNSALRGYNYQSTKPNINDVSNIDKLNSSSPSSLQSPISILSSNTYANSNYSFPLDLRGVKGLKNINGQLMEMSKAIEMMMQNEFIQILMDDLYNLDNSTKIMDNLQLTKDSSNSSLMSDPDDKPLIVFKTLVKDNIDIIPDTKELIINEEMLYTKLSPLIFGLLRTNKFLNAFATFKNEIQSKLTDIIKRKFPYLYEIPPNIAAIVKSESLTEENLALNKIKNLNFEEYYNLLEKYYLYILSLLRRSTIIKLLINDIIEQAEKKNISIGMINEENSSVIPNSQNHSLYVNTDRSILDNNNKNNDSSIHEYNKIKKEFLTLVNQIADIYYSNCSKLLMIRAEKNSQLSSINFHRLYSINTEFINACENITKRSFLTMKSNLLSQAKTYITVFHNKRIRQMVNDIETDQWVPAEITENNQDIVNKITHNEWNSIVEINTLESLSAGSSQNSSNEKINRNVNKRGINRALYIEKKKYIIAACTLTFINTLSEYISCAEVIPILTIDIINSIYSLLQIFNSKVCQIIIGGGAVTSGGLKYIAAKHLALASRSLGAVKAIIPYIKNFLQSKLMKKQLILLNDLDRYSRDYDNHQAEIYDKLISIMNGKLETHCKSFQAMDWELSEVPTQPNVYMLLMVKDLTSLYRLLSKIIPIEILQNIMKEVLTSYTSRLEKELSTVEIYSSNAKNRLLIDFQYYIQKLSLLDGIDGPGNRLEVVVNNITIKEKKPTLEHKTIINEYIRQSFDSGSRRSSIYDENSSGSLSYTNSPLISKTTDDIIESERLSNSPLIIGKTVDDMNESERLSMENLSQDDLNLENNNEIINISNDNNEVENNDYNIENDNVNNNNVDNNDDYIKNNNNNNIESNNDYIKNNNINNENNNNDENDNNIENNSNENSNNINISNSSNSNNDYNINSNMDSSFNMNSSLNNIECNPGQKDYDNITKNNDHNSNDNNSIIDNNNEIMTNTLKESGSDYFSKRHNSVPYNNSANSSDGTGSSLYDRKNSYPEEKNSKPTERKGSYTINKKTFSVFSQNVKKFGSEIKKHYSNNNSMESLFGLDKMVSKSGSSKSSSSNLEKLNNQ
ncbi:hypothetical protein BCR32DRAFT_291757 [Anaeromyces robustus]|uniref:Vacuolar protein sorting-associated protein 54 n=1 Tax=Anaeromyces robustus TaxID=1754192 RepID=A0A1Y1XDH1_9FUNG|nr:hypothetical protein BCR32DRAFT_291757 [Anaeromyces robustus]|eukprot:ORX83775.1 hypothetical protein BCR32DRAFT_291757 [Anaeromyces robustus]